jgi:dihydroorotate dehydrogenase electron transfer subunit
VSTAPRAEPRSLAPPERRTVAVCDNVAVGAYRLITASEADGVPAPQPGQFYMLSSAGRWGGEADERPYLPRAFSHTRACEGRLSFLLEAVGPGTERLAQLRPSEGLNLVGPLGIGWRLPRDGSRPLLVGGGIGAAPLLCLQDELGPDVAVLLGFRSAEHAAAASLFAGRPEVATDDGSAGRQAVVTDLLREHLDSDPAATVYACGPPPMLEAVRLACAQGGAPAQLALESGMACGFGACFGCVVPTKGGYVRLCVDGPVMDAEDLESALSPAGGHA